MTAPSVFSRYLALWAAFFSVVVLFVAVANLLLDPYGIYAIFNRQGVNQIKPEASVNGMMVKAYQVQRVKPRALVLGNSRAEVGFDPDSDAWAPALRPVYNLALPGTGPFVSLRYLQHALATQKPAVVVLGVDFMDFLVAEDDSLAFGMGPVSAFERRLQITRSGSPNLDVTLQRLEDFASTVLSLDAFVASGKMLLAQRAQYPSDLAPNGLNPMRDYEGIARREGYYVMFRQRDLENAKAYLRRPKGVYSRGADSSAPLEILRQIIVTCHRNGIELHLVIYPYHVHLLEIFHEAGLWPAFEEWKRALVRHSSAAADSGVKVWDFSGYTQATAEAVPAPGDRVHATRWYWEAGHFKRALGDMMLRQILGGAKPVDSPLHGVQLTRDNLDLELARIRHERDWFLTAHGADAQAVHALMASVVPGSAK
jgi:hypothetical protein